MSQILWVDDEIDLLQPYIIYLNGKGYEVTTASNGEDALDALDETVPDIVFLDENMPGMSGLETLQEIKRIHPEVPVVMITKSEDHTCIEDDVLVTKTGSRILGKPIPKTVKEIEETMAI